MTDWIIRGTRVVVDHPARYAGEHGTVISTTKHTVRVRLDGGGEDVIVGLTCLRPEHDR